METKTSVLKKLLQHYENVSKPAYKFFPANDNLITSGLHDIDKINIPLVVLNKAGPLIQEEYFNKKTPPIERDDC
ncbi:hypothetical protein [Desulfoscipio gibsoniae]|uniref:hypothetical protein n=1 Tax=Desulfoscipio gibsoniae TaxID=102134 RepID=UPI000232C1FD|nr:hypothetical protein [Desulfoscipio gibsoniae]